MPVDEPILPRSPRVSDAAGGRAGIASRVRAAALASLALAGLAGAPGPARAGCVVEVSALPSDRAPLALGTAARPALGRSAVDVAHGSCVTRLTDHARSDAGRFAKTIYSRSQAFSADDSRALVYFEDGTWHTVDPDTAADLGRVPGIVGAGAEPQWDPVDPDVLLYLDDGGGATLRRVDVATGEVSTVADFAGRLGIAGATRVSTGSSGSPSADGRWWAFAAEDRSGRPLGIVVWDRRADAIVSRLAFDAAGLPPTDTVSMSPSGRHVVAEWGAPTGVRVYPRSLAGPGARLNTKEEHSDLARLPGGRDAYVSIDFDVTGEVYYVDLDAALASPDVAGAGRTALFGGYPDGSIHSVHFSGRALDRPGWVLVSTYDPRRVDDPAEPPWLYARLIAAELRPNGRTIGIAHTRVRPPRAGEGKIYFAEPHGTVNRDFTRVAWNSNWGADDALDVDVYAVGGLDWGEAPAPDPCAAGGAATRRPVASGRWALLGLPCRVPPGTTVGALFGDDLDGDQGTDWALFRFDATTGRYAESAADDPAPPPGEGFWFIHTEDGPRTLRLPAGSERASGGAGGAACADAAGCERVALSGRTAPSRWNLAASPAAVPVPVRDVRVTTSGGTCADGCTLGAANGGAGGVLASPVYRLDAPGGDYAAPRELGTLDPWDGLWLSLGSAARDRDPALLVPTGP